MLQGGGLLYKCASIIPGDLVMSSPLQSLSGHSLENFAPATPVMSRGVGLVDLHKSLPASATL